MTYTYTRKTRDEWQLLINYGQGWEHEISEDTFKEIKERMKEYQENCPQYPIRRRLRRVPLDMPASDTFASLGIGDTFDFINDSAPRFNSFYERCEKISARKYMSMSGSEYRIGTTSAKVFHVRKST